MLYLDVARREDLAVGADDHVLVRHLRVVRVVLRALHDVVDVRVVVHPLDGEPDLVRRGEDRRDAAKLELVFKLLPGDHRQERLERRP